MVAKADNHTIDVRGIRDLVVALLFQMAMQLVKTVSKFQLQQLILLTTMMKSGNEREVTNEGWSELEIAAEVTYVVEWQNTNPQLKKYFRQNKFIV